MPLTLVTGPANSGKAGRVLDAYRAHLDGDAVLVVPRLEDVEHARRQLSASGAVLGGRVVRFAGLLDLLAERIDPQLAALPRARGLRRELLVAEAVRRAPLRVITDSAARPGFARAAGRFLAELGRTLADAHLPEALRALPDGSHARAYAEDLVALFSTYRDVLSQAGCVDDELFARRALDALRRRPDRAGRPAVFVYGFDDFTPIEADAIETLARRVGAPVTVSLPFEPGRVAFRAGAAAYALLSEIAAENVALAASDEHYAPASGAALARIERRLFEEAGDEPMEAELSTALAVGLAGGRRAEVELAGAEVLRALEDGVAPGDVAVVLRDRPRAGALVEDVFGEYGIPLSLERTRPLAHTAVGRGLLALLACAAGDGSAADLVAYLRMPGRVRASQLVDRLEAEVRRRGTRDAVGAREAWEERNWSLDEIDRIAAAGRGRPLLEELERRLERLFTAPRAGAAPLFTGPAREDAAAVRAARAALAEVSALEAAGVLAPLDRGQLAELLGEVPVEVGARPSPDRVLVASPEAVRARRFDTVIMLGLNEGAVPRPAPPEPFLPDELRHDLTEAGLPLPPRSDDLDRERHLFYSCVSRAERRLVLSARLSDDEGAAEAPSPFLDEVRDLFPSPAIEAVTIRRTPADGIWAPEAAPTALERERALAASGPRIRDGAPPTLAAPAVLAELGARRSFSAGELEAFVGCGVRWLIERVVRPRALVPDPEPLRRGRLAHDVLKLTFERLRERSGSARVTPETLPVAEEILVTAVGTLEHDQPVAAGAARREAERRRLEADLLRLLRREASSDGGYEPVFFELTFGAEDGEGLPGLELESGASMHGRVDRVDVLAGSGRALVRDYKAGAKVAGAGAWQEEGKLQVALYMLAVGELTGRDVGGGVYVPLAGQGRARGLVARDEASAVPDATGTDLRSEEDLAAVLDDARARALAAVSAIRVGEVGSCPERCAGGRCAYPSVCRELGP